MYVPYAALYYIDRVHLMCSINAACHHLSISDYLTSEIIVMALGVMLHCPIWFFVLVLLDTKKSGRNIKDFFKYFRVSYVNIASCNENYNFIGQIMNIVMHAYCSHDTCVVSIIIIEYLFCLMFNIFFN
jgi:hypothetical protein